MDLETSTLERARDFETVSRWERAELGRDLRRLGLSYGEIMDLIPVKKSTLATWCRDVELTTEQIDAIRARRTPLPGTDLRGISYTTQTARRREIELIRAQASLEAEHLSNDPLWMAGVSMYWGEGSKATRQLSMANSDPAALRLFMAWAARFLPPETGWRAKLNMHANNDELKGRSWWSAELGVPLNDFTKTFIKPDGTGHRTNHLPYGVCNLTKRRSSDAYHTAMAWVQFLQSEFTY